MMFVAVTLLRLFTRRRYRATSLPVGTLRFTLHCVTLHVAICVALPLHCHVTFRTLRLRLRLRCPRVAGFSHLRFTRCGDRLPHVCLHVALRCYVALLRYTLPGTRR